MEDLLWEVPTIGLLGLFVPVPGDSLGVSPVQGIWPCAAAAREPEPF